MALDGLVLSAAVPIPASPSSHKTLELRGLGGLRTEVVTAI